MNSQCMEEIEIDLDRLTFSTTPFLFFLLRLKNWPTEPDVMYSVMNITCVQLKFKEHW